MGIVVTEDVGQAKAVYCRDYYDYRHQVEVGVGETHHVQLVIVAGCLYFLHETVADLAFLEAIVCIFGLFFFFLVHR